MEWWSEEMLTIEDWKAFSQAQDLSFVCVPCMPYIREVGGETGDIIYLYM